MTALTLGYATWLLPVGALVDRFGERRTLVIGLVGLSAGAATVASAHTYALLLASTFFLGSMYSAAIPGTNKAVYDNVAAGVGLVVTVVFALLYRGADDGDATATIVTAWTTTEPAETTQGTPETDDGEITPTT